MQAQRDKEQSADRSRRAVQARHPAFCRQGQALPRRYQGTGELPESALPAPALHRPDDRKRRVAPDSHSGRHPHRFQGHQTRRPRVARKSPRGRTDSSANRPVWAPCRIQPRAAERPTQRDRRRPSDGNNGTMPGPALPGGDIAGGQNTGAPPLPGQAPDNGQNLQGQLPGTQTNPDKPDSPQGSSPANNPSPLPPGLPSPAPEAIPGQQQGSPHGARPDSRTYHTRACRRSPGCPDQPGHRRCQRGLARHYLRFG